jgi:hypothetical protein
MKNLRLWATPLSLGVSLPRARSPMCRRIRFELDQAGFRWSEIEAEALRRGVGAVGTVPLDFAPLSSGTCRYGRRSMQAGP